MVFYNRKLDTITNFTFFKEMLENNLNNETLIVNLITLLSGFIRKETLEFIKIIGSKLKTNRVLNEIERTMYIIETNLNK